MTRIILKRAQETERVIVEAERLSPFLGLLLGFLLVLAPYQPIVSYNSRFDDDHLRNFYLRPV